jgi:tetratricopeptide (TPR) repeat protein
MLSDTNPETIEWSRYPFVATHDRAKACLTLETLLGLASNTIDAYARGLDDFLGFCQRNSIESERATRSDLARYVGDLRQRPRSPSHRGASGLQPILGLSNATIQQRLTAARLFFDFLMEEGQRTDHPVGRGKSHGLRNEMHDQIKWLSTVFDSSIHSPASKRCDQESFRSHFVEYCFLATTSLRNPWAQRVQRKWLNMNEPISVPLSLFYAYAHQDEALRGELDKHLSLLQRQGVITARHDRLIMPGTDWVQALDHSLNEADIILLLISADFLASDYCYGKEMQTALKRHQNDEACVIPILLRPVDWQSAPFHILQVLPTNGKPVTSWSNPDEAFTDIATAIRQVVKDRSLTSTVSSPLWNIPFPRNLFFTGRDYLFTTLEQALQANQATALSQPQAMSGLGGIGKTQLAVEYAYRHMQDYDAVLWISAGSFETLFSGFANLASLLQLPERFESDPWKCVKGVQHWLRQQNRWLLILDNADDLSLLPDFFPPGQLKGHILLTTRAYALSGLANRIEVDPLSQATGTLLLLHRAGLLPLGLSLEQARDEDRLDAQQIWQELGGLPLALDQAGAYIEETQCGLPNYLHLFRTHRSMLLKQRGGILRDHPASVYTTLTLAVRAVTQRYSAAEDLLWVCALVYPDAIPEEVFLQGASHLGSTLELMCSELQDWNALLGAASAYSLLKRQPRAKTFSVHRLVQAVLQEHIPKQERVQWTQRVITALNQVFPENELASWEICERLVPHILSVEEHTRSWANTPLELAALLQRTARQITKRMQYKQAEPLYLRALQILEPALGSDHPDLAILLERLATLSYFLGRYEQAESFQQRVLFIKEQILGADHPEVAQALDSLAYFSSKQGKDEQAELLYQQAIHILERQGASNALQPLVNLGEHYQLRGKFELAETLYQQALDLWEQTTDTGNFIAIVILTNWSHIFCDRGEYQQAEHLSQRALQICEQETGSKHLNMVVPLRSSAYVYGKQKRYEQAELLYQRALIISDEGTEKGHEEHPDMVRMLQELADLYQEQGKYEQAKPLYRRVLRYNEQTFGLQHSKTAEIRKIYDELLQTMSRIQGNSANGDTTV